MVQKLTPTHLTDMKKLHGVSPDLIRNCSCAVCDGVRNQSKRTPTNTELPVAKVVINNEKDLLHTIPALVGFTPKDSIVVLAFDKNNKIAFSARVNHEDAYELAPDVMTAVQNNNIEAIVIAGIGDDELNRDMSVSIMQEAANSRNITVGATLFASNNEMDTPPSAAFGAAMKTGKLHHYGRDRDTVKESYVPHGEEPFDMNAKERDQIVANFTTKNAAEEAERWRIIAVNTSNPDAYTLSAVAHYVNGNGLEAGFAVDQAINLLGDNTDNKLPHLLRFALSKGLPPVEMQKVLSQLNK